MLAMPLHTTHSDHWIVQINHRNRSGFFFIAFVIVAVHMMSKRYGPLTWALMVFCFLLYPQIAYFLARLSPSSRRIEHRNLMADSFLSGISAAALGLPVWITFTFFICSTLGNTLVRGRRGTFLSVAFFTGGTLLTLATAGFHPSPQTEWPAMLMCMVALSLYLAIVSSVAYSRNHTLHSTRKQLELSEKTLHAANASLQQQIAEINVLQTQLGEQAHRDPLTGLYNRRYLDATLARELARCEREGQPLSVMMIDIDHFKQVNDTYGHLAGDRVLIALATLLNQQARTADVVCRFGGEEFLLLLPNMPQDIALARADQWRQTFASTDLLLGPPFLQVTLSIGLCTYPEHGKSAGDLIRSADAAMYRAKLQGRNRVILSGHIF
jgi:diguanylate cyclase